LANPGIGSGEISQLGGGTALIGRELSKSLVLHPKLKPILQEYVNTELI
jgi:hypothetical protein